MIDVHIYGAGVVGSVLAREARFRGMSVRLSDPNPFHAASQAALAIGRLSWFTGQQRERMMRSITWYTNREMISAPPAVVTSSKSTGFKIARDFFVIDPKDVLLQPDDNQAWSLAYTADSRLTVVATGVDSFRSAGLPPARQQCGHTLVTQDEVTDRELQVHNIAPYRSVVVVRRDGETRLGSSVSKSFDASKDQAMDLLVLAEQRGLVTPLASWSYLYGVRAVHPEETGLPIWYNDSLVVLSGFARSGFSLAPARAIEVLDSFEVRNAHAA